MVARTLTLLACLLAACIPATAGYPTAYVDQHGVKVVTVATPVYVPATVYIAQPSVTVQLQQAAPAAPPAHPAAPAVDAPPRVTGLPEDAAREKGVSAAAHPDALAVLRDRCQSCHNPTKSSGGFALFGPSGELAGDLDDAYYEVRKNRMPPSGPLSAAEKAAIRSLALSRPAD